MKQLLKILKSIPAVLARIAHVIEHMFCDEVPSIDEEDYPSDEEDDF